jgi:hypothetical protein
MKPDTMRLLPKRVMRLPALAPVAAVLALLCACITTPTHESKLGSSLAVTKEGRVDDAIQQVDAQTSGGNKDDMLLNLEKGELLRIGGRYGDSLGAFQVADVKVKEWEETAKSNPAKLMGQLGAVLLGDASRAYEGQDYEKVMLTTRMAMDRLNLGDIDTARVDIKRTHEREAVIAEFRAKETAAAEQEAKDKGINTSFKELNGYPTETINDPEVLRLKNGFQNALSHYLAGFVYETLNEPGLAAPGYRKAIELRPGQQVLEEGLRGLDQRTGMQRKKGATDLLFVVEAGNAPARQAKKLTFPVPTRNGLITVSYAFPVIYPDKDAPAVSNVLVGTQSFSTALITDFNVMARKALKDELPGMQIRAALRAIGKGVAQDQANKNFGSLGGLLANAAAVVTEGPADDRMWRSLPERVFVARGYVAPGDYDIGFTGRAERKKISVDGRYMIVPVRLYQDKVYFGEPAHFGSVKPLTPVPDAPKPARKAAKPKPVSE